MSAILDTDAAEQLVRERFQTQSIALLAFDVRRYPDEVIFVVRVDQELLANAAVVGNQVDRELRERGFDGFVAVRSTERSSETEQIVGPVRNISDARVEELLSLVVSRARTSETQPSLNYIRDAAANIERVITPRHHLVFGRRGAGKTALLLEAKRLLRIKSTNVTIWVNLQTYRRESAAAAFLWISDRMLEEIISFSAGTMWQSEVLTKAEELRNQVQTLLGGHPTLAQMGPLVPRIQSLIRRATKPNGMAIYLFLDDFHYIARDDQADLLDLLHGCFRDCDAWLKVAAIKHLSRWFKSTPPTGLQTGHDADAVDLDLSLQDPSQAKKFLEKMLSTYATKAGISSVNQVFINEALDRLVLASGAVPRDYLTLCAGAMRRAKERTRARGVGKQDVTKAAGDVAQTKIAELEDDAASAEGSVPRLVGALTVVRRFCVDDKKWTYFRIDFHDKEAHPEEYGLVQGLMDVRLIHLVNPSVSDAHQSGVRSEAYMLDLSQFSGERMKHHLRVLDFEGGHLALNETGSNDPPRFGKTARGVIAILRRGPLLSLNELSVAKVAKVSDIGNDA